MPLPLVMEGSESFQPAYEEISWKNATLLVEDTGRNTARVVRLISTDPADYLDPALQPGSTIQYTDKSQAVL
jgi:hypothetical protein